METLIHFQYSNQSQSSTFDHHVKSNPIFVDLDHDRRPNIVDIDTDIHDLAKCRNNMHNNIIPMFW